ncbi:hypothetical protein BJF92_19060 [Rhizobium rhizosphaerae]|uniref:Uncharacterized protein n=1 Tax=Xaviernesmea rhizosphaerae TaxID=1672749 RepID=A0A1Q9ADV9_9HYPH|nr:hypothetical protein BJF92_19060 [Xaviernesmea rhizosphaerae]
MKAETTGFHTHMRQLCGICALQTFEPFHGKSDEDAVAQNDDKGMSPGVVACGCRNEIAARLLTALYGRREITIRNLHEYASMLRKAQLCAHQAFWQGASARVWRSQNFLAAAPARQDSS